MVDIKVLGEHSPSSKSLQFEDIQGVFRVGKKVTSRISNPSKGSRVLQFRGTRTHNLDRTSYPQHELRSLTLYQLHLLRYYHNPLDTTSCTLWDNIKSVNPLCTYSQQPHAGSQVIRSFRSLVVGAGQRKAQKMFYSHERSRELLLL